MHQQVALAQASAVTLISNRGGRSAAVAWPESARLFST
jgi:hypothetical protein